MQRRYRYRLMNTQRWRRGRSFRSALRAMVVVSLFALLANAGLLLGAASRSSSIDRLESAAREPRIIWLMSFPHSGTSYTIRLVTHLGQRTQGTNYRREVRQYNPIFPDQPRGPFWLNRRSNYTRSENHVLTKTHCGGYCSLCPPMRLWVEIPFPQQCATETRAHFLAQLFPQSRGDPTRRVVRAVHLIRDPLSNVVARFRGRVKGSRVRPTGGLEREDFRAFCQRQNRATWFKGNVFWGRLDRMTRDLPCRVEFYKYARWHNNAFETTDELLQLKTLVLHYDTYETDFNATVQGLMEFLHLEPRGKSWHFIAGKTYDDFFTTKERQTAKLFLKEIASPRTWSHIKRYFGE